MEIVTDKLYNWASDIEPDTLQQALRSSRLPVVHDHIALMPDAHFGMGATVGSVIPTKGAVIPAAVGVDIGCGMIAAHTSLYAENLPDDLGKFMSEVEQAVPAGVGQGHHTAITAADKWMAEHKPVTVLEKDLAATAAKQFGSLGSGNHFVEICLDEDDSVWLVLHSGSRGIGNKLAQRHIKTAKDMHFDHKLEDPDLAYFIESQPEFHHYIGDMRWAQDYAMANRQAMMTALQRAFLRFVGQGSILHTVNCHHNFTQQEVHNGVELWITRKGAIKAGYGDWGIIPGSMGTRSYVVSGLGNEKSWESCSHGAGRRMSRGRAKREFTIEDLNKQMEGKVWLSDRAQSLLDEIPSSYKDIDQVMADQQDLVQIEATLHQILNYKGC